MIKRIIQTKFIAWMPLFLCITLLSGCASLFYRQSQFNSNISWNVREKQLKKIQQWHMEGVMGVQIPQKSFSAHFVWEQKNASDYQINLFGPLGMDAVNMIGKKNKFTLHTSSGQVFTADNPEQLVLQQLGWRMPISDLYYWIRGLPADHFSVKNIHWDAFHHIQAFEQKNWHIHYLEYQVVNGVDLPKQMILQRDRVTLRINIQKIN